jgi:hypothetical protein
MEAEARSILTQVCTEADTSPVTSDLQEVVERLYGNRKPRDVVGDLLRERRLEADRE